MATSTSTTQTTSLGSISQRYQQVRQQSVHICQPLAIEDYVIQSIADVSPPKWHLAHTTWFFETFLLIPNLSHYQVFHPKFNYLFNSYYESIGERYPRPHRGILSRPTVEEVYCYRAYVDQAMQEVLSDPTLESLLILGLHHEQQHQELLVTDIKHILASNPLKPVYQTKKESNSPSHVEKRWLDYPGGIFHIGYQGSEFCFDNELPLHQVYLQDYWLAPQLVTNGEYLEFIEAGGYTKPEYWLSEGWGILQSQQWNAPLYWEKMDGSWWIMTLHGLCPLIENEPVCHVSYFEADAFARWAGKRLPTEAEWEVAAGSVPLQGNLLEQGYFHPMPASGSTRPDQLYGDVWEWTQSAYLPYPGFEPASGAVGEYNGKFMCNQMVLRGGSCATPASHLRPSYRNFFPPAARWQFTGIRLASLC
jgi:ergothioneine biosynthesis protein EgtB